MSTEIVKDIICPQCGEPQSTGLRQHQRQGKPRAQAPHLDERCSIGAATAATILRQWPIPFCTQTPRQGMWCVWHPGGEAASMEPPQSAVLYQAPGKKLAELKEKILILDAGFDDVAVELVKNALCTIIQRTYRVERLHAYFSRINGEEMEFAIFLPRKPEPVYHSTKLEVYRQSQEVLRSLDFVDPQALSRSMPSWPASCWRSTRIFDGNCRGRVRVGPPSSAAEGFGKFRLKSQGNQFPLAWGKPDRIY